MEWEYQVQTTWDKAHTNKVQISELKLAGSMAQEASLQQEEAKQKEA